MRREIKENILMIIIGIAFFLNIIVIILSPPTIKKLVIAGYAILGIGAFFFILSVFTILRKDTGNIVDSGIYGIVRHPMYLGAMLMFFSHIFLGQNWIVTISTVIAIVCCYLCIQFGDQRNIEKFDDNYKRYMQKVPRTNFLLGIIRLIQSKK